MIVARVGSDLRQIANELDKIKLYLDGESESTLDAKTLARLIPPSRELIVFNLIDAVAQKNRKRALAYAGDLMTSVNFQLRVFQECSVRSFLLMKRPNHHQLIKNTRILLLKN